MITEAGLFTFPWDFVDEGVDEVVELAAGLGLTHLIVASVYHAGFFLYPHNPHRRTHLVEDGVAYFHPNKAMYRGGPIRPRVAALCRERDWFAAICERAIAAGLKLCAWTVICHNTRLGLEHPEATVHNPFGDSYAHALAPGHPATVAYGCGLVNDLGSRYPVDMIYTEAVDYRPRKHGGDWVAGHHHERDGTHLRSLEMQLLDLSFNPTDVQSAEVKGIDANALRRDVVAHLTRYFDAAPDVPPELPETLAAFEARHPVLTEYRQSLGDSELALATALRDAAHSHDIRVMGDASPAVDIVATGAYGQRSQDVERITVQARSTLLEHQRLAMMIRMGFTGAPGSPIATEDEMVAATQAVAGGGAEFVAFYNYAEAPGRCVQWIRPALEAASGRGR